MEGEGGRCGVDGNAVHIGSVTGSDLKETGAEHAVSNQETVRSSTVNHSSVDSGIASGDLSGTVHKW